MEDLQNVDGVDPKNGRRRLSCKINSSAKEKHPRRRGVGVAELEKMRLLEQANEREELGYGRSGKTVFPHSQLLFEQSLVNVTAPSSKIQRNVNWVIGSEGSKELTSYQTMRHYFDTCPNCLKKRRRPIYSIPKDFNMKNVGRERNFFDDAAVAQGKSGRMEVENSEWSGAFLDLSLSTINYSKEKEKIVSKVDMGFYGQDQTAAPETTLEEVFGEPRKAFSPLYCREATSVVSSPAPPSLELTLGLPI